MLDAGLGAEIALYMGALAVLICLFISVLSAWRGDSREALTFLAVAVAVIPVAIAAGLSFRGTRVDSSGVWRSHWYGWHCYPADAIDSVEWSISEGETGGPESRVLLYLRHRPRRIQVYYGPTSSDARAVANDVGHLLGRPVRRNAGLDHSERFRDGIEGA